jgi:hypothetical protein
MAGKMMKTVILEIKTVPGLGPLMKIREWRRFGDPCAPGLTSFCMVSLSPIAGQFQAKGLAALV